MLSVDALSEFLYSIFTGDFSSFDDNGKAKYDTEV